MTSSLADGGWYERAIGTALTQPETIEGLSSRMHFARVAMDAADTPGRRHFARTQFRAARRRFDRLARAGRPSWRTPAIAACTVAITAPLSMGIVVLLGRLIQHG